MTGSSAEPATAEVKSETVTPATASTSTSVPPRGRSTTATPAPRTAPRFKPKAVRRSSADRARLARELGQISKAKDEAEEKRKARLAKAIVRVRGRGGFRGGSRAPVAVGPLAGGGAYGGSSGGGRFARADYIKKEGSGLFTDDGRVNADLLHDYVQDFDEDNKDQPLMPMGIRRVQPKSQEDADKEDVDEEEDSDEEGLFVNEKERAAKDRLAAKQASKVKTEGGGKDVDMDNIPPRYGEADTTDYDDMLLVDMSQKLQISSGKAEELRRQRNLFAQQLDDRAFIFQFPVRPPLYVVKEDGSLAKTEGDDDVVMLDGQQQDSAPVDLTTEVKEEEVAEEESKEEVKEAVPQAGYLGKLIVRKSGKVEIDWGGYPMDSGTGVAPRHLSTAVLLESEDAKPGETPRGFAYSMGRVEAVFSSVLRTSDMEPWVVDDQAPETAPKS
ncbi:RNA polymerase III RPC4-domain-containing protein [Cercophora samala]|uniref:RNA polymerase III RPC4-domain-containing protein n=1 Tax=Cercophora samala TaxID=330535 RepID=A0AA40DE47_9PEZI|nr:RNA polymerase III RPC4-domain-containing protein [Cercophora samala]